MNQPEKENRFGWATMAVLATLAGLISVVWLPDPVDAKPSLKADAPATPFHRQLRLLEIANGQFSLPFQPEYDRGLDTVILAVHFEKDPQWTDGVGRIVSALPDYTRLHVMLPPSGGAECPGENELIRLVHGRRHPGNILRSAQVGWVQDLGEGVGNTFLLGMHGQNIVSTLHQMGLNTARHYLPLDGGNVQLARNQDGKPMVFIGLKELKFARERLRQLGEGDIDTAVRESYCLTFQAEKLVVLSIGDKQMHIDQSVLFLRDGLVAVEEFPPLTAEEHGLVDRCRQQMAACAGGEIRRREVFGPAYRGRTRKLIRNKSGGHSEVTQTLDLTDAEFEVLQSFQKLRPDMVDLIYTASAHRIRDENEARLKQEGFQIIRLKTSVWHHINRQSYVNAMPFRHRESGRDAILLPVYHAPGEKPGPIDLQALTGLNEVNRKILEAHAFDVIPVQSVFQLGGNLHCMMYQLSPILPAGRG